MSKYARKNVQKLHAYQPGEQPKPGEKVIKLNTNENPFPPSPKVLKRLKSFGVEGLRKYPQPMGDLFIDAATKVFDLPKECFICGNGSDELLAILIRTFVGPGGTIAYPTPTYSLYPVLAEAEQAKVIEVPFDDGFKLPAKALRATKANLVFLANPNAPSGTMLTPDEIARFAKTFSGVVVVDEAYVDFADSHCLPLTQTLSNVIVTRTLSKGYGLAGLRFGFAVGPVDLIDDMLKVKDSYNCDAISLALATEAITDQKYLAKTVADIRAQRAWLTTQLTRLGYDVTPSQANFLWAERLQPSAADVYRSLKAKGILVRYFDKPGLRNGLRITVGKPAENRSLIAALADILKDHRPTAANPGGHAAALGRCLGKE